MKILHTADWHIGQFRGPVVNGVNQRFADTIKCLDYMVEVARGEHPDLVCVSGDIFHYDQERSRSTGYSKEVLAATKIIDELSKCAGGVIVMRGTPNHDGAGPFSVLEDMFRFTRNVEVVTTPQVIQTPVADIACIPGFDKQDFRAKFPGLSADEENLQWSKYISDLVLALSAKCTSDPAVLMAHYTVPGCNMESGQTSFFANFEPVIPREALLAADYDAVLLGHIHRPQQIKGLENTFYSGAINMMNFNDEAQNRGFYIHEFAEDELSVGNKLVESRFIATPFRKFQTLKWTTEDLAEYLRDGMLYLQGNSYPTEVSDKIVRLQYECTPDQRKALNVPVLQNDLYNCGAFYVADIEAESTIEVTNRGLLSEESDPLLNLKKWLDEKCYKDADKIVELAEPIIAAAQKQSSTAEIHGVFRPVSISVRNYRNYKEETFDFSDISFCTINGVNGAGKSSLFMDAITDCLFEETREGDCKAWLRGAEDARSGSIEFIFEIGTAKFRVVRTRTKSGKPTLNLSRLSEDGSEWLNMSKERIVDTQAEIERIIGMDSMTFRSCALIMQDQYGLFLQARKEDRIAILGNLLGLGIYGVMEQDARKQLGDAKRELMSQKDSSRIKTDIIREKGDPERELETVESQIAGLEEQGRKLSKDKESLTAKQAEYEAAVKERASINEQIKAVNADREKLLSDIQGTLNVIEPCAKILANAGTIRQKADEYRKLVDEAADLRQKVLEYDTAQRDLREANKQADYYQELIKSHTERNLEIDAEISGYSIDDSIEEQIVELEKARAVFGEMREKHDQAAAIQLDISNRRAEHYNGLTERELRLKETKRDLESYKQQEKFMKDSGCPDIANASCRFLQKAASDVSKISAAETSIKLLEQSISEGEKSFSEWLSGRQADLAAVGFDNDEYQQLAEKIMRLQEVERKKKQVEEQKLRIARLEAEKESNSKIIAQHTKDAATAISRAQTAKEKVSRLTDSVSRYQDIQKLKESLAPYETQERQLPVYEERRSNAAAKLKGLEANQDALEEKQISLGADLLSADEKVSKADPDAGRQLREIDSQLSENAEHISNLQVTKGTIIQKADDVKRMRKEIGDLNKAIEITAAKVQRYEVLKTAFSQDGLPHQISRNIIPHVTDTANNILGSMTGGTMGVEFVMERTVKGRDGDKATLDVLINEYGKTTLPYASKSGGEKVKASLAVILALAEIKTTAAGIQLGMLFIDEPPFLDDDGTQAYVDALETIRRRYPDVKVMAITHDDAMKARFSQSVTVIKSEDGSHVQRG